MVKKNFKSFVLSIIFFIFSSISFADSPITSTDFYLAYNSLDILDDTYYESGVISVELMNYLDNIDNSIDVKMAIINKLSWDIDGKRNSDIYMNYLMKKYKYKDELKLLESSNGDHLLCIAYLKAMDNYFEVDEAIWYAMYALKFRPKSYTYNIILTILKSQKMLNYDWNEIYNLTTEVKFKDLEMDMKDEAIKIIYEYLDSYEE